ncbi:T9SS type A sorting domain-containing protein [Salegentibacter sp. JZCK2]|uniref:LamG-like jellyroll fold domain-containing protein n=1 Tax=Salegentibacter tibetensis TaxID=2873600 RepID=UPI001CCECC4F|nr:LamG-like jellyroll fold domain-containing protein [Salegentibacter tibetensis]MBZ9728413.1 T9SS type A sorting domain-containing protein [Salegentibacter tibetensis]
MSKITSSLRTGGLLVFLLVFTFSFILASTETSVTGLTVSTDEVTPVSCFGGSNGAIKVSVTGGNSNYTYSWSGPNTYSSSLEDINDLIAGTYNLEVTDTDGNSGSVTVVVDQPDALSMASPSSTPVSCNGGNDGTATAGAVSGGNGGYQYKLDAGIYGTSNSFSGLTAGTYTITVKDSKNCETSQTVTVTQPDALAMTTPSSTPVSCNGGNDGTATAGAVSGGNGGYQYKLDAGTYGTSNSFSGLTVGTYTITVKDSKNCETSQTVTVTQPDALSMAAPSSTPVSCNGGNDGTATAGAVSGGNGGYQYKLDAGIYGTSNSFSGLTAGTYTITVKDSKNCETSQTVTVTQPDALSMAAPSSTPVSCNGGNDGTATAGAVSGGNGGYQYKLDAGIYGTSNSFTGLTAGTYTITVKDSKNCETSQAVTVTQPDALTMTTPSSTPVSCNGGSDGTVTAGIVAGGNGDYLYSIDNVTYGIGTTFSGLSAGTHTIFVKDSKDCALQKTVTVSELAVLSATVNHTNISCFDGNDGTISLSSPSGGSGSYEYSIDGTSWQIGQTFSGLKSGSYKVYIRDATLTTCVKILKDDLQLTQPAAPLTAELTSTRTTTYGTATGTATANPSGGTPGYTYEWRKAGSTQILQQTKTAKDLYAGEYEVTVTDTKGCKFIETITVIDAIHAPIIPTSICDNDTDIIRTSYFEIEDLTALGGVGPYTYSWNFGPDSTPSTATGPGSHKVTYTTSGDRTVSVTVTDASGVSKTVSILHYVGECFVDDCGSNDFAISTLYIADANGNKVNSETCDDSTQKYIYFDLPTNSDRYSLYMEYIFSIEHPNGELSRLNKGACFYENQLIPDNVQTIPVDWSCGDVLIVERLYLTFSNNIKWGCGQGSNPKCYSTNNPETVEAPLFVSATANELLCHGSSLGTVKAKATGGVSPYTFSITGENGTYQNSDEFNNLTAGTYTVWVKDSEGTKYQSEAVTITQPLEPISADFVITNPLCFGETGEASANAKGGTPFVDENGNNYYEYLWNDPNNQTFKKATGLTAGDYTLTVTDANGCQFIESITITEPAQLTVADAGPDQSFNCGFNTTTLSANTPGTGVGTWTITSANGGTIAEPNNPASAFTAPAGIHTLRWTIAHADGSCANFDEVKITFVGDCSTLDFDGIDDHVYLGDNYGFTTGNFSIEAWIRPKSVNNTRTIISKRNSKDLSKGFDLIINSGAPTFRWGNNSISTSHKVTADRWHHIAAIYNSGNISLYVDGIQVGNATATNPAVVNAPALIGAMYNADSPDLPVNYFHGWIEEVRLWGTALSEEQLRFMMNQRLIVNQNPIRGDVLPLDVPGNLGWDNLKAYLQMKVTESGNGITPNLILNSMDGELKNIETDQENTAPLPYESDQGGTWHNRNTWDLNSTKFWTFPNDIGINGTVIEWNIAKQNHNINSNNKDIKLLGLFSGTGTELIMEGVNNNSGNELRITHYLELDGFIDLDGESQLVQTEGSILAENSSGSIERDQQGTENSYNYNYWTSPASPKGTNNNANYTVKGVMRDGTSTKNPQDISFAYAHTHADANYTGNKRISTYWLFKFHGDANSYGHWRYIGHTGELKTGEGFTMKGTSGQALISDQQNYVFNGKPHNGTIALNILNQENRLVGNPYPSAIDADQFIRDNLKDVDGGTRNINVFNGALYFWDHFGQENSHVLREYVGGYATYSLAGGVKAASTDSRINATGAVGNKTPGRYIPVAQGFFVNSVIDDAISGNYTIDGGDITFRNRQRVFVKESSANSQFLKPDNSEKEKAKVEQAKYTEDTRYKIRLNFHSPKGYHRQILVTADSKTTNQFDLGYDAPLIDNNVEDMFWMMEKSQFVIQAVPNFNLDQKLPIGVKIAEEKEFRIEIGELENVPDITNIYLYHKKDSTYHDLRKDAFKATLPAGEYQELYEIVFHDVTSSRKDKEPGEGPIDYYYSLDNREFVINNPELHEIEHINIYSIGGQLVDQHFGIPNVKQIHIPQKKSLSSSVYIVKVYTSAGDYAKKVIIKD